MDLLLTPLVTRLLKQYVKRSSEGSGSDLKVSFSRGNVLTLHNLELNLAPLLGGAAALAHVRRAFARRLSITIPWTALTTQPIQVVLDTVELVLSAAEQAPAPTPAASTSALSDASSSRQSLAPASEEEGGAPSGSGGAGGGWFGSTLQTMALRAGLHVTVKLTNVVAKWVEEGQYVAAATLQELLVQTSADDWAEGLQNPEAWLKKECSIKQLSISLDQHSSGAAAGPASPASSPPAGPAYTYQPLLRVASLTTSALLPAFAWLEGADLAGDPFTTTVMVQLSPLHVSMNDRQLCWAGSLAALMQAAAAAKQAAAAAEEAAAEAEEATPPAAVLPSRPAWPGLPPGSPATPPPQGLAAEGQLGPGGVPTPGTAAAGPALASRPQTKALGVFGRVWDFLIDEAAYVESDGVPPNPSHGSPTAAAAAGPAALAQRGSGQQPALPSQPVPAAMPMHAELQVVLEAVHVTAGVVVDLRGSPGLAARPAVDTAAALGSTQQQQEVHPDLEDTLRRLRAATARNDVGVAAELQHQLAAALGGAGSASGPAQRGQGQGLLFEVHPCAELRLERLQVAVASVDASISGVAVELKQLTLRRSTAAAPLLTRVLAPAAAAGMGSLAGGKDEHAEVLALSAAAAAAGTAAWVEVVSLEPEQVAEQQAGQAQQGGRQRQLAVSLHYFDSAAGPGAAPSGKLTAPGQLRCSVVVGRLLLAHAPGLATNMVLLAKQYGVGSSTHPSVLVPDLADFPIGRQTLPETAADPELSAAGQAGVSSSGGGGGDSSGDSSRPSVLAQALQPQLLLDCRVAQVELAVLASQAPEAAALVLLLRQLELRSGALNWEAPWNSRLRNSLLAPPQGFGGHGIRLSLAAAELAVADAASAASGGLWQLQRAAAVSNVVVFDAVLAAAATTTAGAAGDGSGTVGAGQFMASAALSPLQLQLSGLQVAAVASAASAASAEASQGFATPLLLSAGKQQGQPWLSSASLSCSTGIQLAYAAGGGLQRWSDPHGGTGLTAQSGSTDDSSGGADRPAELFVSVGTVSAGMAATPAPAAPQRPAEAAAASRVPGSVLLQVQLVQTHAWLQPELAVHVPAADVRLGQAALGGSATLLAEPVLLLAALTYSSHSREQPDQNGGLEREPGCGQKQRRKQCSSVQLASVSVAVGAADYPLAVALLGCLRQQPALPPMPFLHPPPSEQPPAPTAVAASGTAAATPRQHESQEPEQVEEESELVVSVGAASVTLWPQAQGQGQGQASRQQQPVGLAAWLSNAQLCTGSTVMHGSGSSQAGNSGSGSSGSGRTEARSVQLSLGTLRAALLRRKQVPASNGSSNSSSSSSSSSSSHIVEFSPVLSFPSAGVDGQSAQRQQVRRRQQQQQPALHIVLRSSWSDPGGGGSQSQGQGAPAGSRTLQLHAAPLSVAVTPDLMAAAATVSSDLSGTKAPEQQARGQQAAGSPLANEDRTTVQAVTGLQGKAALQGLRLLLLESASWEGQQQGRVDGSGGGPCSVDGWQVAPGAAALEVVVEEAVVLLQQAPAAENRPWLAGSPAAAGALLTSTDASLIGAAITVWHEGQPGADATAVLPPTDGRLDLLLQPHTGAVAVAVHAQLLPLQVSLPAVSAISTLVSTVFGSGDDAQPQPQPQPQRQPHAAAPSAAAVAAAATFIIEDASAILEPHARRRSSELSSAGAAGAELELGGSCSGEPAADGTQQGADDLSAALFTFVHSSGGSGAGNRPVPLQVVAFSGTGGEEGGGAAAGPRGLGSRLGARLWGGARQEQPQPGDGQALRHGIRFCYPQPREVVLLAIEDAPAALLAATFQLSFFSPEENAYLALPLQAVMVDGNPQAGDSGKAGTAGSGCGRTSQMLLLLAEEPLSAAEWEVSWELPAGFVAGAAAVDAQPAAVLHRLRVNPRACGQAVAAVGGLNRQLLLPPPLAASLTVVLTAEGGSLALLSPVPLLLAAGQQRQLAQPRAAVALMDAAAVLHAGPLRLAVHTYPAPEGVTLVAADLQATLALCLPDSSSATAPASAAGAAGGRALLEPFHLDAAVEYHSGAAGVPLWHQDRRQSRAGQAELGEDEGSGGAQAGWQAEQPMFWQAAQQQQQQELPLLAVRPPPLRQGLSVQLAAQHQPLVVNVSEGSLAEVKRLMAVVAGNGGGNGGAAQGQVAAATAATAAPLLLVNHSGLSVQFRQQGTQQQLLLQEGQHLPLVWPAPPALVPGAIRRVQLALAAVVVACEDESAWSIPLDIMATGGCQLELPNPGGAGGSTLAVQVRHSPTGSGWEVLLLPAVRLANQLSQAVHVCLSREVSTHVPSLAGGGSDRYRVQQQHQLLEVASEGSADVALHGGGSLLRLWLGGDVANGTGWSQAIPLPRYQQAQHTQQAQQEPVLMVLHCSPAAAATAMAAGVRSPASPEAAKHHLGAVLAQLLPPDPATGQSCVRLWPPLLLRNAMPCAVRVLLPAMGTTGAAGVPGQQQMSPRQQPPQQLHGELQAVTLPPGGSRQLAVPLQGGAVGALLELEALSNGADAAATPGSSSSGADCGGGRRGLTVVVPPLIAESAEQQWFGGGTPQPGRDRGAGAAEAVFIAPPGEAACLRVPLVVASPGGLPVPAAADHSSGASHRGSSSLTADCLLVTEQQLAGMPLLQLTLHPALVVHNCLPCPLLFQVPGVAPVHIPAGWSLPLPSLHSPDGGAAEEAVVLLPLTSDAAATGGSLRSQAQQQQQEEQEEVRRELLLKSQPFRLEVEGDDSNSDGSGGSSIHLVLASEPQPAPRSSGGLWRSYSSNAAGGGGPRLECHLAAKVDVQQHVAAGGAAAVAAVSVAVAAGCYVSNLSGLPLAMLAEGAVTDAAVAVARHAEEQQQEQQQQRQVEPGELSAAKLGLPQGSLLSQLSVGSMDGAATPLGSGGRAAGRQGTLLPHSATVPLLQAWRTGPKAARRHRQGSWGSTSEMLRSFSGGLMPSATQATGAAGPAGAAAGQPALRFALLADPQGAATVGTSSTGAVASVVPGGGAVDPDSELPTPRPSLQQPQECPPSGGAASELGLAWSAALPPFAVGGRQRLYLQPPAAECGASRADAGDGVMLTYRVLQSRGSFHLVLFRDRQPPFVIENATSGAVDVGYFPPTEAADGSFTYNGPQAAIRVGPGRTLECDLNSSSARGGGGDGLASPREKSSGGGGGGSGGWEDQEDEDAFLDCLLREELHAAGQEQQRPPPVLKFRTAGSKEWRHPCVLLPGLHLAAAAAGSGGSGADTVSATALSEVHVSKCCATTRILLLPSAGSAAPPAAAALAPPAAAEPEPTLPLWIEAQCSQLQVCLWDDERRRLFPFDGPADADGDGSEAGPLGRELFSLSVDSLRALVAWQRYVTAAGAAPASQGAAQSASERRGAAAAALHPWQRQLLHVMAVQLTAAAMQLDSYLPGREQPVLLTSLPVDDSGAGGGLGRSRRRGAPLQLALEMHHCVPPPQAAQPGAPPAACVASSSSSGGSSGGGASGGTQMSLRNTWVHDLLIQLPTLAAAADDSLLLFAERLSGLLSAGSGHSSGTGGGEGGADGAEAHGVPAVPAWQRSHQLELLQQTLAAEAAGAAASRLYIEQAIVESVRLLLDAHIAAGTAGVPVAVDTYRAPVTLSRIAAHDVLFRPHILVRGLMAHGVAEAVLNAPQVLGSLSLLFNPTGLVQSVRAGVADLIGLPLAALQNQSLTQFVSGVGLGSVSLVRHTLGWTLTSISGFSQAFSRAVDSAVHMRTGVGGAAAGAARGGALAHRPPPSHLGHGFTQGLAGLAEGVAAGITGVVRAPMQGYSSGSGVLGGIGRGLLGAVGLPVSGALELVGSVSAGLASSAGVIHVPQPRRSGRLIMPASASSGGEGTAAAAAPTGRGGRGEEAAVVAAAARLMQHPVLLGHLLSAATPAVPGGGSAGSSSAAHTATLAPAGLGRYHAHAPLLSATVLQGAEGLRGAHFARGFALHLPVLLVTEHVAVLFSGGGLEAVLVLRLEDTEAEVRYNSHEVSLFSLVAAPAGQPAAASPAAVQCRLSRDVWLRLAPLLRRCTGGGGAR